ncbi:hypothetical protein COCON_G00129020 [Conger conger]|uniref:Uncharacterized protein n=1 Tax=Conger conger TaxID=82655 RepID=A0A9Q1HWF9_CONCO|nr:hypothetical protein COCON_G00129020 [Conger conger]
MLMTVSRSSRGRTPEIWTTLVYLDVFIRGTSTVSLYVLNEAGGSGVNYSKRAVAFGRARGEKPCTAVGYRWRVASPRARARSGWKSGAGTSRSALPRLALPSIPPLHSSENDEGSPSLRAQMAGEVGVCSQECPDPTSIRWNRRGSIPRSGTTCDVENISPEKRVGQKTDVPIERPRSTYGEKALPELRGRRVAERLRSGSSPGAGRGDGFRLKEVTRGGAAGERRVQSPLQAGDVGGRSGYTSPPGPCAGAGLFLRPVCAPERSVGAL